MLYFFYVKDSTVLAHSDLVYPSHPHKVSREYPVELGPDGKHLWVLSDQLFNQAKPGDLVTLFTGR